MKNPIFLVAIAILLTAMVALMLFGGDGKLAGMPAGRFASATILSVWAMTIAAALFASRSRWGRGRISPRLWHVALWLAILAALIVGYRIYHAPPATEPAPITDSQGI